MEAHSASTRSPKKVSALRRVFGAAVYYGLAPVLPRIINFILLPIFAAYLPPEQMGILEIATGAVVLMQAVSRLGITGALSRQYIDHREPPANRDLVTTIGIGSLVMTAVSTLLALAIGPAAFGRWLSDVEFHPYMDIAFVTAFFGFFQELQSRLLQVTEQPKLAARLTVALSLIGTIVKVFFVVGLEWGVLGVLYAELLTALVTAAIVTFWHRAYLRGHFRWSMLKAALAYGVPLVPQGVGAWAQDFGGRWVMGAMGVLAATGQLGVASRIVSPLQLGTTAFSTAFQPVYFTWRKDLPEAQAVKEIRKVAAAALTLVSIGAIGAGTFGTLVLRYGFPAAYVEGALAVGMLAAALQLRVVYFMTLAELLYAMETTAVSVIFFIGAAATVALTILLVPLNALLGAAAAQLIGVGLTSALYAGWARRTFASIASARHYLATGLAAIAASVAPFLLPGRSFLEDAAAAIAIFAASSVLTLALAGIKWSTLREVKGRLGPRKKERLAEKSDNAAPATAGGARASERADEPVIERDLAVGETTASD
jgi:O-antigen/teichoic acid export membrane protein